MAFTDNQTPQMIHACEGMGWIILQACASCGTCRDGKAEPFKACPWKTVYCCQKSCQVTHWKEHKLVCPYHAKRKQQKEGSSKSNEMK